MKIIRHLTPEGRPGWAALQPDGTARAIDGDVLREWRVTERLVATGELLAPVEPVTVFGIGLNYRKHAEQLGIALVERPLVFMKSINAVQRPGGPIAIPRTLASEAVDYEGELAIVIGRACKNATRENALSFVLGYTIANDVSARDWQFKLGGGQFCQGKSFDTFCPLGPVLVTPDELDDAAALRLETRVNGEVRQEGSTADLIFDVRELIVFLSASKTLLPGTVILTGTPGGAGHTMKPPIYLKAGDVVSVTIEKIGTLTNPVILEA
ncbi:MAG: 5-carboxymethyl-2-hydroxymuconate isomerase [Rariglobus sp.]|jgi:2-keto-4-pentenoate hydratase/2-oxohepta-3-ene-1,7-dioic acid hydratase in catechol pathway|nr:5-carboxymethyl-2-hydroxymuconate isomerase [Rariglobus sp.]